MPTKLPTYQVLRQMAQETFLYTTKIEWDNCIILHGL